MMSKKFSEALEDCKTALKVDPTFTKVCKQIVWHSLNRPQGEHTSAHLLWAWLFFVDTRIAKQSESKLQKHHSGVWFDKFVERGSELIPLQWLGSESFIFAVCHKPNISMHDCS